MTAMKPSHADYASVHAELVTLVDAARWPAHEILQTLSAKISRRSNSPDAGWRFFRRKAPADDAGRRSRLGHTGPRLPTALVGLR